MADVSGKQKLFQFLRPYVLDLACEIVADQMEDRRKASTLRGIGVVDPEFIENWSIDEENDPTLFLMSIFLTAAQTARAKDNNKLKKPEKMRQIVTRQLLNQSSNRCLAFQAEFGLFLWSTGCARQTIDALFRCELSVSYDSVLRSVESLATHCILESIQVATDPHAFCYDNITTA
ncbi:hypothetical protein K438DRAFT_1976421 [Mycena galopus ATCC 62051]|nr:hypothetical protein K438DRAFT_1976421 [Mycena galopus ATCC 62051]